MASAISLPISSSLFAEIRATCSILFRSSPTTFACPAICFTTSLTALSIPLFNSMGLAPAVTFFRPTLIIDWARTVAVVVPSPASSPVLEATSLTIWAPIFSKGSSSSISLATVTPSLLICGAPNFFSSTTLRPLGPSVTFTVFASWSTPSLRRLRASISNLIFFAISVSLSYYVFMLCIKYLSETSVNNLHRQYSAPDRHIYHRALYLLVLLPSLHLF